MQAALRELCKSVDNIEVVAAVRDEMAATSWSEQNAGGWDIATVDLILQEGSGFNVVKRLCAREPKGVVVVLSEYASPAIEEHCRKAGADAVFRKSNPGGFADYLIVKAQELARSA
jgi:DNA-binding NarL/FixJ family response regulator